MSNNESENLNMPQEERTEPSACLETRKNESSTFNSIVSFVEALHSEFGKNNKPLQLYNHLLEKTHATNTVPVSKHILAFKSFISINKDHLLSKKFSEINGTIFYSEKVFINMTKIIKNSDELDLEIISKHLYNIWAHIEPESEAQNILKTLSTGVLNKNAENSNENDFIENIMNKVESAVGNKKLDETSNPMEAMQTLMQSGIFNDIFQGMTTGVKSGKLDINKMLGTVQNLVKKISPEDGNNQLDNMMGMLGPMMSGMMGQKK